MKTKIITCPACDGEGEDCPICDEQQGIIEFPESVEIKGALIFNYGSSKSSKNEILPEN